MLPLLLAALLPPVLQDTPAPAAVAPGHYEGELVCGELTWRLGVDLGGSAAAPEVTVDVVSRWALGQPATEVVRDGERLAFDLPLDLGRFTGTLSDEALRGSVRLPDGRTGEARLAAAPRPRVRLEELELASGPVPLAATLGLPVGPGPFPALALVPGGGDSDRSSPFTRFLAEYLPRFGIAFLVYDKRGCGGSGGDWRAVGLDALAEDAVAAVEALATDARLDAGRIGLFGASQGSWVAGIAASRDPRVRFLVHHSGPAVSVVEADTFALLSSVRRAGHADPEAARRGLLHLWELECQALRAGRAPDADGPLLEAIAAARDEPWFARQPYGASAADHWWTRWYPRVMEHDPRPLLRRLDVPMLWLFGARDSQSDPVENLRLLTDLASDAHRPYTLHVFPGAGHGILVPLDADGNDLAPLTLAPGYFEVLLGWLRQR